MSQTIERLQTIIAGISVLSQKARLCHWNIEGAWFLDLHEFFGEYYDFLSDQGDDFAERIRALDEYPKSTYQEFLAISPVAEQGIIPSKEMVATLLQDTNTLISLLREWIQNEEDLVTQDMFIGLIHDLEKKTWMMKSLKKSGAIG